MNTFQAMNSPAMIRMAGESYPVRALTIREMTEVSVWIDAHVVSPLGRAIREIAQIRAAGGMVDQDTEDSVLDRAEDRMTSWPPRPGTKEWVKTINTAPGGLVELVRVILSKTVPGFDLRRAEALFDAMSAQEFESLYHMGVFGTRPKDEGEWVASQSSSAENVIAAVHPSPDSMTGVRLPTGF